MTTPDGVRLWAETRGRGPHLLLAHGGPGVFDYLDELAARLEDVATVTRFEQRGCGRSEGAGGPFTVAQAVADVEAVREAAGAERWVVGGHSWGASLALLAALEAPERALGVLYVAGVGVEWARWRSRRRPGPDSRNPAAVAEMERLLGGRPENARAYRELGEAFYAMPAAELLARCRGLEAPVLVVEGADDPRPNAAADSLVEALPAVERITLRGAGHSPWLDRPDDFLAIVRGWFERVSGSS